MKILIVEDDVDSRVFLERALKSQGYIVESASNGVEALEKALQSPPDLIISDILMPEMDGFELCHRVKTDEKLLTIPFIFYTATYTGKQDEELAMSLGASRFLIKPMEPEAFFSEIRKIIENHIAGRLPIPHYLTEDVKEIYRMRVEAYARKLNKKIRELEEERKELRRLEAERENLLNNLRERIKELKCINIISRLAEKPGLSIEEFVHDVVNILPSGWQYPEICSARVMLDLKEFKTPNFKETQWSQSADIKVDCQKFGTVTVYYLEEKPSSDEGPFLKEERELINTIADFLGHVIQHRLSEEKLKQSEEKYRSLFDQAADLIVIIDLQGNILDLNIRFEKESGWNRKEMLGKNVLTCGIITDESVRKVSFHLSKLLQGEFLPILEIEGIKKDGEIVPYELRANTIIHDEKIVAIQAILRNITERKKAEKQIEYLAYYDALTGLPNRNLFIDRLKQGITRAKPFSKIVAVLIVDIDRFRSINDTFGNEVGDKILKEVADRLSTSVRPTDTVARFGNDEFGIALLDIANFNDIMPLINKIMKYISSPLIDSDLITLTFSAGVSIYPHDSKNPDELLNHAGLALGIAKKEGGKTYQFYTGDLNVRASEFLLMQKKLQNAIKNDEFVLHYQPYWEINTKKIVGMEALIRWQSKDLGLVPPGKFIPVLEDTRMIIEVGEWILRTAIRQMKEWQNKNYPVVPTSVNLSLIQFRQKNLSEMIMNLMAEYDFYPSLLTLEITESAFMHDIEVTNSVLKKLKDIGVAISIDDFGTGYSSLSYLKRLPIDNLKIDISFIKEVVTDPNSASIIMAIINMAHALNLKTIAEGIETEEQRNFLRLLKCDMGQGYYFSKPLPAEEIEKFFIQQ